MRQVMTFAQVESRRDRWLDPDHLHVCVGCGVESDAPLDEPCDCGFEPFRGDY